MRLRYTCSRHGDYVVALEGTQKGGVLTCHSDGVVTGCPQCGRAGWLDDIAP